MEVEAQSPSASASGSDGSQNGIPTDLSIDFQNRCSALLSALGINTNQPSSSSSVLPLDLIHTIQESTSLESESSAELFNALSLLASSEGISEHVARTFEPILLDLCARWIDTGELPAQQWEWRLSVLASVSLLRPDMWK